jgi:hypothetical protein
MAIPESNDDISSDDFIESSYLTYAVPSRTNLSIEELFSNAEDSKSIFDSIEQRQSLFFGMSSVILSSSCARSLTQPTDETVDVLLILRTPWADEQTLRSYLGRLVISLEAQVANTHMAGRDNSPPGSDVIFTGTVEDTEDPFILVDNSEDSDAEDGQVPRQHVYAVWKLPVFLGRPRIRLQGPSVVFSASASVKPQDAARSGVESGGYLHSGVPSGFNLLESLGNDPALRGVKPRLSALRVSRVAP